MLCMPFPLHINTTVNCCKHILYLMLLVVPDSNVNLLLRLDLWVHMILPPVHMWITVASKMKLPLASQSCREVLHWKFLCTKSSLLRIIPVPASLNELLNSQVNTSLIVPLIYSLFAIVFAFLFLQVALSEETAKLQIHTFKYTKTVTNTNQWLLPADYTLLRIKLLAINCIVATCKWSILLSWILLRISAKKLIL